MKIITFLFTRMRLVLLLSVAMMPAYAIELGGIAPSLTLDTIANTQTKKLSLEQLRGKVVYLDFWASWCGPCRKSFPVLEELHQQYQEQGLEIVGVNLDEDVSSAHEFLNDFPASFPIVADPSGKSAELFSLKGMPSAYVIDKNGKIRHEVIGFNEYEKHNVEAKIIELLREP